MNANYVVQILQGDYTATYTIYFDSVDVSNIATLLGSNLPAEGISLNDMLIGVRISVPGSATSVILVGDGFCESSETFSITPIIPPVTAPDLCMRFNADNVLYSWQFTPNSTQNGKTKWETSQNGRTYTIGWNPLVSPNRWEMQFEPLVKFISINTSEVPTSSWSVQGFSDNFDSISNLNVLEGTCPTVEPLNTDVIADSNICEGSTTCSGIITVVDTVGGTPPYTYKLDNLSETTTTIFENVCPGIHTITTTDSDGIITTDQVTIDRGINPVQYVLSLELTRQTITDTINRKVVRADWNYKITPELPVGSSISFELTSNIRQDILRPGSGNFNYINNIYLDGILISPNIENTQTSTLQRNSPCEAFSQEITEIYKTHNITMTQGTTLSGFSLSEMIIPERVGQNVNGCITQLKQQITFKYLNLKFLGPCSTVKSIKPEDTILSNTLEATVINCCPDGYIQVGDICEITTSVLEGVSGSTFTIINGQNVFNEPRFGTIFYSNITNVAKPLTFRNNVIWNQSTSGTTGVQIPTPPNCVAELVDGRNFYNQDGTFNNNSFSLISRTFGYYDVNLAGNPVQKSITVNQTNVPNSTSPWFSNGRYFQTTFSLSHIRAQLPDDRTNLNQWFGVKYCFTATTRQTYHLYLIGDDMFSLKLDGEWLLKRLNNNPKSPAGLTGIPRITSSIAADGIIDNSSGAFAGITLNTAHVIPITISEGEHSFEFSFTDVWNYGDVCCTAASFEVYTGITTAQLTGITNYESLQQYTAFSTKDLRNTQITAIGNSGDDFGIYCPPGYNLEGICDTPFCVKRQAKSC
jgi:hypothetical protein